MSNTNLVIIHFQPLEMYPPIQNLIKVIEGTKHNKNITIICSGKTGSLQYRISPEFQIKIIRKNTTSNNRFIRLIKYFIFYVYSFSRLMIFRPSKVLYFESISSIPAILYKLFFPDTRLFVHYHEYTTLEEYSKGMQVVRWNHYLENRFYFVFSWISHTNKKRLNLFHLDHPKVNTKKLYCFPNYPSSLWSQKVFERNSFADRGSLTLKLVYVGALSVEDTYIFEILDFVAANSYFELEIFSFQMEKEVMDYVESKKCSNIKFSGSIDYANIPLILKSKDIGLILYKGKTLNYIHNAPNKLFEYLNCGLDVWYPKEMIGCRDFKSELNPQVFEIDFNRIEYSITDYEFSYDNRPVNYGKYSAEDASKELLEMLLDG